MSKKDLYIKINGELINVTEEVYLTYYRMESRARYLEKKDNRNGKILFSNLDTDEMAGEDGIPDLDSESVEDAAIRSAMADKLYEYMDLLPEYERELLIEIYFNEKSEVQLAKELGVLQQTISYKKLNILKKLKKCSNNFCRPPREPTSVVRGFLHFPLLLLDNFISSS